VRGRVVGMAEEAGAGVIPAAGCKELLDAAEAARASCRDHDDGNLAPEPAAIFGALSRTEYRDAPINDKVAPAHIAALGQ